VIDTSRARLAEAEARNAQEIRDLGRPVIAFSENCWSEIQAIRRFLFARMYRAPEVMETREEVTRVVEDLFPLYMRRPELLPARWQGDVAQARGGTALARLVSDYIAGMTDRFALQQHAELCGGEGLRRLGSRRLG